MNEPRPSAWISYYKRRTRAGPGNEARWTKLGAHARSRTSVFKTTTVFFSGEYGFSVLPSSLQSVIYSCPRRTSRFLESVATTRTTTTLAWHTTNREISCHSAHQVPCLTLRESTTPVYLAIYGCCSQQFLCHRSYACTCLDHEHRTTWAGFRECPRAIKLCLPRVYPWHHACDKCTRLSPSLAGRALGRVSLIAGMEYGMERWNGKWNGTVNVYSYS